MSNSIKNTTCENMTLDKLKSLFSGDSELEREKFLEGLLRYIGEPSDSRIIALLNNLCKQYNDFFRGNGQHNEAQREKAKTYHQCLYELFDWLVPFLTTYHQLVLYTNLCILSDDDTDSKFHNEHFSKCLEKATEFVGKYGQNRIRQDAKDENYDQKKALCTALYSLGFLNLKENHYTDANNCFEPCVGIVLDSFVESSTDSFTDVWAKNQYFNCAIRMANCYEYQDDTWKALHYLLGLPASDQDNWVNHVGLRADFIHGEIIKYYNLPSADVSFAKNKDAKGKTIRIVREICEQLLYPPTAKMPLKVFELDKAEEPLDTTVKQYIHVLAHCLSEYAAKLRRLEISGLQAPLFPACSTLQLVSRFLLDWLVTSCGEDSLVSCQATIRAENDACPEAISLLLRRYHLLKDREKSLIEIIRIDEEKKRTGVLTEEQTKILDEKVKEKKTCERELTEVAFYLFYFSEQELRFNYKDNKLETIFKYYGESFKHSAENTSKDGDYDSLFHYYVIRVKYLLKRKAESLLRANESTDYSDLDYEFAQMCTYKEKCSDHIFTGLIEEYERLAKLYSVFQKFRWLTKETSRPKIRNELEHLLSYSSAKKDDVDKCFKSDGSIDYDQLVRTVYEGIRSRKKILILAPVKDAPSCSSEYDDIKKMIDFCPMCEMINDEKNLAADSFISIADSQDSYEIQLKELNGLQDTSKLKFAIHIDTTGSTSRETITGITYLYMKREEVIAKEYREVVPLFMEGDESKKLKQFIVEIMQQLREYRRVLTQGGICPSKSHDSSYGAQCCTYHIPYSDANPGLLNRIRDLLVFLEYDFHASMYYPICKDDIILISHPHKSPHQFFAILVYDAKIPEVPDNKGLCFLCENFCLEHFIVTGDSVAGEPQGAEKPAGFCKTYPYNTEEIIRTCLVKLNQVKQENSPNTENRVQAEALEKVIAASCAKGNCNMHNQEGCYVENARKTWRW